MPYNSVKNESLFDHFVLLTCQHIVDCTVNNNNESRGTSIRIHFFLMFTKTPTKLLAHINVL